MPAAPTKSRGLRLAETISIPRCGTTLAGIRLNSCSQLSLALSLFSLPLPDSLLSLSLPLSLYFSPPRSPLSLFLTLAVDPIQSVAPPLTRSVAHSFALLLRPSGALHLPPAFGPLLTVYEALSRARGSARPSRLIAACVQARNSGGGSRLGAVAEPRARRPQVHTRQRATSALAPRLGSRSGQTLALSPGGRG